MIQSYPQRCFLFDLPDLVITGVSGNLSLSISVGEVVITEKYQPSGGTVTVYGLAELVKDYIDGKCEPLAPPRILVTDSSVLLTVSASDEQTSSTAAIDVIPCREPLGSANTDFFLTRYKSKNVNLGELFLISFIDTNRSMKVTVTNYDGSSDSFIYVADTLSSSKRVTFAFDSDYLCDEFGTTPDNLQSAIFQLVQGSLVLDTVTVNFNQHGDLFAKTFVYDNVFYVPETITFRGSESEQQNLEANFSYVGGKYSRLSADQFRAYTARLGQADEQTYRSAEDMLLSDDVRIFESNDKWSPVVIISTENEYRRPKSQPAHFAITYRESGRHDQSFNRNTSRLGLFDKPFSKTFD